jgi:hypothetical protein
LEDRRQTSKLIMMIFNHCSTYYLFYGDAVYPRAPDAGNTFSSSLIKNISAKIQDFPCKGLIKTLN